jgi:hypothetical protein
VAVQAGPHDAQDSDDEQDGKGRVRADEDGGEDGGHDVEGRRGGVGQRGEESGDGAGEGAEDEGGAAEHRRRLLDPVVFDDDEPEARGALRA